MKARVFIFLLVLASFPIILSNCDKNNCINGEGAIVSQNLDIAAFDRVELSGSLNVTITQGSEQSVVAVGQQNIINQLSLKVSDGKWNWHTCKFHHRI